MKAVITFAVLVALAAPVAIEQQSFAAVDLSKPSAVEPTLFMAKLKLSELVDGKSKVVAEPILVTADGKQAQFLSGGQILVDKASDERLSFGLEVAFQVHEVKPNELRVSLSANKSDLADAPNEGDVLIREHGVRVLKTVKPGATIDLDLGDGGTVSVRIDRAERVK